MRPSSFSNSSFQAPGHVGAAQVAADQRLLQPVAQDHVQRIAELVGLDADEAVVEPPPGVEHIGVATSAAGSPPNASAISGASQVEELAAAPRHHLQRQRLALVHGHAAGLAAGAEGEGARQVELVHGVPRLVQRGEDGETRTLSTS